MTLIILAADASALAAMAAPAAPTAAAAVTFNLGTGNDDGELECV